MKSSENSITFTTITVMICLFAIGCIALFGVVIHKYKKSNTLIKDQNILIKDQNITLAEANSAIEEKNTELEKSNSAIKEKDNELRMASSVIEDLDSELKNAGLTIENLNEELKEASILIEEQDLLLKSLSSKVINIQGQSIISEGEVLKQYSLSLIAIKDKLYHLSDNDNKVLIITVLSTVDQEWGKMKDLQKDWQEKGRSWVKSVTNEE